MNTSHKSTRPASVNVQTRPRHAPRTDALFLVLSVLAVAAAAFTAPSSASLRKPPAPAKAGPFENALTWAADCGAPAVADTGTRINVGAAPARAVITPNGAEVYVTNNTSNTVSVINTATDAVTHTIPVGSVPDAVAVSPDGSRVYVGNNGGTVSVINTATHAVAATVSPGGPVRDLAITPDGTKVYLALEFSGLRRIDTATNAVAGVSGFVCPEGVGVTPDGSTLYVNYQCGGPGGSGGHDAVGRFNASTGAFLGSITGLPNVGGRLFVSPDGAQVWENGSDACSSTSGYDKVGCPFVGPGAGVINVISTATNTKLQSIGFAGSQPGHVSFAPGGTRALVGHAGNLSVYDTSTFALVQNIPVPASGSVVFAPNGKAYAPLPGQNRVAVLSYTTCQQSNTPPEANDDLYTTGEDTTLTVAAPGVLSNDNDADGNDLTASLVANAAHGAVALNADGSFTYTPAANYAGPDSFTYKANDGTADSNVATVQITITAPVCAPLSRSGGWALRAPLAHPPQARFALAAAEVNGKLYAVGGVAGGCGAANTVEVYDPSANSWTPRAPMPTARYHLAAASLGGKLYASGGGNFCGTEYGTVEVYDPASNSWATRAPLPTPRQDHGLAAVGGKLYAMGGGRPSTGQIFNDVYEYDPASNAWTAKANMPVARTAFAVAVLNGRVYAVGGYGNAGNLTSVDVYDPATNTWSSAAPLTEARVWPGAAALNGKLYAYGGSGVGGVLDSAGVYDPAANSWSTGVPMLAPRSQFGAAAAGGKLYAVGGEGVAALRLSSAEAFTPPSGLVAFFPAAGNADDAIGGNHGTLQNGAAFAAGKVGQAFSLDGVDDYVQVGQRPDLVMTNAVTIDVWIYPTGPGSPPDFAGAIVNQEGQYELHRQADGSITWAFANTNPGWISIDTGFDAPLNQWTHLAVAYDAGTIRTYANGALVHTFHGSGALGDHHPEWNDFRIGGRQCAHCTEYFRGRIDELKVFNRALSAEEVLSIYNAGSAGFCNTPPTVSAGGPYAVDEGATVTLSAAGSDVDGDTLSFTWDFDGDGLFDDASGPSPSFSAAGLDGPAPTAIKVRAGDGAGGTAVSNTTVFVNNVAPTVDAGPDSAATQGSPFVGAGSFNDPGADNWTAIADYGDGTGAQPLALNPDKTFALSHTYSAGGFYTLTVTIDDGHASASATARVTVFGNTCTAVPAGAVAWYPAQDSAADIVGGHDGTPQNGAAFAPGRVGRAFSYAGPDDIVRVPHDPDLNLGTGDVAVDAWMKFDDPAFTNDRVIVSKFSTSVPFPGYTFRWLGDKLQFIIDSEMGGPEPLPPSLQDKKVEATLTRDTQWHHVAAVRRGLGMELYYDGVLVAAATHGGLDDADNTGDVGIGNNVGAPDNGFPGLLDEVRIFKRALSASEVQALYLAGGLGACHPPTTATAVQNAAATYSPADQTVTLYATVTPSSGAVNDGAVTFTVKTAGGQLVGSPVAANVTGGAASALFTLPGGTPAQTLNVTAAYLSSVPDFQPSTGAGTLAVGKAAPAISWDTPAPITYGTPLSASQLNATADVPGTFAYNPAAGAAPPVGDNTLSVTFTPDDAANYTTAAGSVTLRVNYGVCVLYDQAKAHKGGSTVPFKLQLCDAAGANLSSPGVVLTSVGVRKISDAAWGPSEDAGHANPDLNFRFADGAYVYNLKTAGLAAGTYRLGFVVGGDASQVYAVGFKIR